MSHKNVLVREKLKFSKDLKLKLKVIEEHLNRCHERRCYIPTNIADSSNGLAGKGEDRAGKGGKEYLL